MSLKIGINEKLVVSVLFSLPPLLLLSRDFFSILISVNVRIFRSLLHKPVSVKSQYFSDIVVLLWTL